MRIRLDKFRDTKIYKLYLRYRTLGVNLTLVFLTVTNVLLRYEVSSAAEEVLKVTQEQTELKLEIKDLKDEKAQLLNSITAYNAYFNDFPWPIWIKIKRGNQFFMYWYNDAYYDWYLKPKGLTRFSYYGKTDFDIYNNATATVFFVRDMQLSLDGGSARVDEQIINDDSLNNIELDVLKWRKINRSDTLLIGQIIPPKLIN